MKAIPLLLASAALLTANVAGAEEKPVATIQINVQPKEAPVIDPVYNRVEEAVAGSIAKQSLKDQKPVTTPILIKDASVNTVTPSTAANPIAGTAPTASAPVADPLAQRPTNTYRSLQEANQAGINPLASAPKIQTTSAPAAAAETEDTSILARLKAKWLTVLAGILMIAGGALLLTGRKS